MLYNEAFQLIDWIKEMYAATSILVSRLKKPSVVSVVERITHCQSGVLALLLVHWTVLLDIPIHLGKYLLLLRVIGGFSVRVALFFYDMEVVYKFIEFLLTERGA